MQQPGLGDRHRDRNGEISRKHGNTLVRSLRRIYGEQFARGFPETATLAEVLHQLDEPSLSALHRDHDGQLLDEMIERHS